MSGWQSGAKAFAASKAAPRVGRLFPRRDAARELSKLGIHALWQKDRLEETDFPPLQTLFEILNLSFETTASSVSTRRPDGSMYNLHTIAFKAIGSDIAWENDARISRMEMFDGAFKQTYRISPHDVTGKVFEKKFAPLRRSINRMLSSGINVYSKA